MNFTKLKLHYFLLIGAFLLFATHAFGHDWYPWECCHNLDCKPVPCEEILPGKDGSYVYDGLTFTKDMVKASMDKFCHACIGGTGDYKVPKCIYPQLGF